MAIALRFRPTAAASGASREGFRQRAPRGRHSALYSQHRGALRSREAGQRPLPPLASSRDSAEVSAAAGDEASSGSSTSVSEAVTSTVEVRVYNIDRYGMSPMASKVLKKKVEGIYHVGITAFGNEYWYDHQINQIDLGSVEYCFGFGPEHTYDLGTTSMSQDDFEEWLYSEVKGRYTIDKYDCFYHNCHHFANELSMKLTDGQTGIPQWCIDHGEKGLEMLPGSTAERYRAASNKIARIMMVCWGRYNQQRFVEKKRSEEEEEGKQR